MQDRQALHTARDHMAYLQPLGGDSTKVVVSPITAPRSIK
jgi:hypothetical protein